MLYYKTYFSFLDDILFIFGIPNVKTTIMHICHVSTFSIKLINRECIPWNFINVTVTKLHQRLNLNNLQWRVDLEVRNLVFIISLGTYLLKKTAFQKRILAPICIYPQIVNKMFTILFEDIGNKSSWSVLFVMILKNQQLIASKVVYFKLLNNYENQLSNTGVLTKGMKPRTRRWMQQKYYLWQHCVHNGNKKNTIFIHFILNWQQ